LICSAITSILEAKMKKKNPAIAAVLNFFAQLGIRLSRQPDHDSNRNCPIHLPTINSRSIVIPELGMKPTFIQRNFQAPLRRWPMVVTFS
jgi:hypothetical protein